MDSSINGMKYSKVKWQRRRRRAARRRPTGVGSVEMKVKKLQKLIPGGNGLKPDHLMLRTADYILHLKSQVHVLQALSMIYKPS